MSVTLIQSGKNIRMTVLLSGEVPEMTMEPPLPPLRANRGMPVGSQIRTIVTGKEIVDVDLKKPLKKLGWFEHLPAGSIDDWVELRQQFTTKFSTRRACFRDPTEIAKTVRKANETLVTFKERWIVETGFIEGVAEVIKISSFMASHKYPELAKRYYDKVPKTVDEMMVRLDDFVSSEEAFASTELPMGELSETPKKLGGLTSRRDDRFHEGGYGADRRRNDGRNTFNNREELAPYRPQAPYQALRGITNQGPMQLPPKKKNQDIYCGYHREKGHYTNDCFQLRRNLESALESGKLNHLIKDVRQRGWVNTKGREGRKDKVINMIQSWADGRKSKTMLKEESWMKTPIVFPTMLLEDISDEPIIIEAVMEGYLAVMEGYLVRRIHVDQGASVEVMFEHCFKNLSLTIESRLKSTQTDLMGFAGNVVKPLGRVELEAVFGDGGLFRRVPMNFTIIRAHAPCNIILGRTGMKTLRAVSSTIHFMAHPKQLVIIRENLYEESKTQLKMLLKKNMYVVAWYPSNMTGLPRRIIEHSLNDNLTIESLCQKMRVLAPDRSQAVIKEVEEWLKTGIVRLVRYSTWISNPVLVKKGD
nr:hypothetical protein [Tanacetum cinerariifolium]